MFWNIFPLSDGFVQPTRGYDPGKKIITDPYAIGYDLYAPEDGFLDPLTRKLIPLGFSSEFAPDYGCRYCDRSGMANKGITYFGGLIESSYRNEWKVILYNSSGELFCWNRGDRLIQAVFSLRVEAEILIVTSLSASDRGLGGIGSTGA